MNINKHSIFFLNRKYQVLPNRWDCIALALLFSVLGWLAWGGTQMATPYQVGQSLPITLHPSRLPLYAGLTVIRMLIALGCSLMFTLTVGTLAAKNRYAEKIIIPLIDILQSVPVLGFLSLTITGFIRLFPGNRLGPECAAIFAIFTAQVWNMTLSFYQSLRSTPHDLVEATTLFQLSAWQRFWRLEVPFALPSLLWNMMLSMSGSWVFLVASESISVSGYTIQLPGIGSYLGLSIKQGSLPNVAWAVVAMLSVILTYDQLFFRPLTTWSYKFNIQESEEEDPPRDWLTTLLQRTHVLQQLHQFTRTTNEWFLSRSFKFFSVISSPQLPQQFSRSINLALVRKASLLLGSGILPFFIYYGIQHLNWNQFGHALLLGGITGLRVLTVVLLSTLIWVPVGVWIGLRPRWTAIVQPVVQFLAAFPANVLFPLVVILVLKLHLPFECGVLPLMLLGSQWYILFNVIAGAGAIPKELYYISENLGVTGWLWWKRLILPGIFPHLMTGIITAVGAAWNISVVAEIMQWGSIVLKVKGLGAYIDQASTAGHFSEIAAGMAAMSLWVLIMNYFVWQPLYRLAQSHYRLN